MTNFASAVEALAGASEFRQPALTLVLRLRPRQIAGRKMDQASFGVIVIGAGSAGSVLANRLFPVAWDKQTGK
jgi:hypothetical protein